jgi:ATP-binding protein involved in chromosome partitioning
VASREEVLERLAQVKAPDGQPLPATGVLSDVVVSDGKVFFSLTVDAAAVPAWEPVRKAAEAAVRSVPGVTSALVALTAERAAGAARTRPPSPVGRTSPAAAASAQHQAGPRPAQAPEGVKAIIAVASGKGGVGK